jgi:hypothetical protein
MNRALLKGVSRERPDLYSLIGGDIRERRQAISALPGNSAAARKPNRKPRQTPPQRNVRRTLNGGEAHA